MKRLLITLWMVFGLASVSYSAQQTILGGTGVYWSAERIKINANFTELYAQAFDVMLVDIAALTDPGADRIAFWDDSAGEIVWLSVGTGLTIALTEMTASGAMTWPTAAGIPYWTTGTAWGGAYTLVTTIGATGSDTNIPSEQAVREAFSSIAFNMGGDLDNLLYDTGDTLKGNAHNTKGTATTGYVIGTDDERECYGGTIYVTSAATIVACDVLDAKMGFTVITVGAIAVRVDPQADDGIMLDGEAMATAGVDVVNTSTTGDILHCEYYSADGWYCGSGSPDGDHWTEGT